MTVPTPPNTRRFWFDTEFIERGPNHPLTLISIGIVSDDGREFYAESSSYNPDVCSPWVQENVLPHLHGGDVRMRASQIGDAILDFVGDDTPEFWAYYADYDWVILCQLFGTMMDLPDGWPMFCMDLKQLAAMLGYPPLPEQTSTEHNALDDARWTRDAWMSVPSVASALTLRQTVLDIADRIDDVSRRVSERSPATDLEDIATLLRAVVEENPE